MTNSSLRCAGFALALIPLTPANADSPADAFGRDPSDPVSSFAVRDKAGRVQMRMVRPAPYPDRPEGERCLPGTQLCLSYAVSPDNGAEGLRIRVHGMPDEQILPLDIPQDEDETLTLWPLAVHRGAADAAGSKDDNLLIGIESTQRLMYSGGGGYRTTLWLYRIEGLQTGKAVARQILSVPFGAGQLVRACFNEKDEKARRGACHDETAIEATLVLDAAGAGDMPRFIYQVSTRSFPSTMPYRAPEDVPEKLAKADLVWAQNEACSYARAVAWNPATARYEFDRPAPDCRIFGLLR